MKYIDDLKKLRIVMNSDLNQLRKKKKKILIIILTVTMIAILITVITIVVINSGTVNESSGG